MVPRFIYITGCDGTGKTTQACLMIKYLASQGIETQHVWLRFPFLFSIPLLAYARLRGFSWYEVADGVRHGYWNFRSSWILGTFLPWSLLIDAFLSALANIYIPLWMGKTIVCDRFAYDMLVDLTIAFADPGIRCKVPGRLFPLILPRDTKTVVLDLDVETIISRRPDLSTDRNLKDKLSLYREFARDFSLPLYSSRDPIQYLNERIIENLNN